MTHFVRVEAVMVLSNFLSLLLHPEQTQAMCLQLFTPVQQHYKNNYYVHNNYYLLGLPHGELGSATKNGSPHVWFDFPKIAVCTVLKHGSSFFRKS